MNDQTKKYFIPIGLGLTVLLLGIYSITSMNSSAVTINGTRVSLTRDAVRSDPTGGSAGAKVTNYAYLVNNYSGYSYADAIQHYLAAYLRLAHQETYNSITIDEASYKKVDNYVSTFKASYGQNKQLTVEVTNLEGIALTVKVTSDDGKTTQFNTGQLDLIANN